jgi:hypothetical protein
MVPNAQMVPLGLDVGVDNLVIEKLRVLRIPDNPPLVVIKQAAEESKLTLLVEHIDTREIAELTYESLRVAFEPRKSVFMRLFVN